MKVIVLIVIESICISPNSSFFLNFRIKQKHAPAHEIPKDVEPVEVGHLAASIDVSSRH